MCPDLRNRPLPDIFLSYNREDQAVARRFAEAFRAQGFDVWWDTTLRAGEAYDEVTEAALREAKAVVVLWSKKSVASRWVRAEATLAERNKTLAPAMIEACERPIMFELTQTAELSHWRGDARDKAWLAFLTDVRRFVENDRAAPAPTPIPLLAELGTATGKPTEPIVAVLPFDNLSSDAEMQFFSDGVSEEIIQRLSRGARIKVIGRTSSFQFRGDRKAEAAPALKCSHILDGSIRRAAGRVRISAHLVEASSQTTLWSERYDRGLEDIFAVQDEISDHIAAALSQTFTSFSTRSIDPAVYDLYLRTRVVSFAPEELRGHVSVLETATQRAPHFAEAWGRLAFLRSWVRFYEPFANRAASAALISREAARALALDPQNVDAMTAQWAIMTPFGGYIDADAVMDRIRDAPGLGDGRMFVGWQDRALGRVRDSAEFAERIYRLDPLNPTFANAVALARMSVGRFEDAVPVLEDLMARMPDMSFAVANLMRAYAFLDNWDAIDHLLHPAAKHPLREFEDGLTFIATKRHPTRENIGRMRTALESHYERTGCVDLSRLVYSAHLGLGEDVYRIVDAARLGPRGTEDDVMGPDGYRTGLLFWQGMPEIRNDPRFVRLCARLGLVEFWTTTRKWPDCADEVPYDFRAECEKAREIPKEAFGF